MSTRCNVVRWSFLRSIPLIRRSLSTVFGLVAIVLSGCGGTIYVSHPQVNTRERLVDERYREHQWLKQQLEKSDEIETTYQGLRDFREFVGFYNELRVSANPTQGALDKLENEAKEADLQTQLWNHKAAEYDAYQAYLKKTQPTDSSAGVTPASPAPIQNSSNTADVKATNSTSQPLAGAAPLGRKPDELKIPDPASAEATKAKPNLLDLFHDRLAYRNAVNSAMKSVQLDDSHDLGGQMLHELNLEVAMTPADSWVSTIFDQPFAQVSLKIEPEELNAKRARQLTQLYSAWSDGVSLELSEDIGALQGRITEGNLTETDIRFLRWFAEEFGPYLVSQMEELAIKPNGGPDSKPNPELNTQPPQSRPKKASRWVLHDMLSTSTNNTGQTLLKNMADYDHEPERRQHTWVNVTMKDVDRVKSVTAKLRGLCDEDIRRVGKCVLVGSFPQASVPPDHPHSAAAGEDVKQDQSDERAQAELCADLREAAGWAMWGANYFQLSSLVGIAPPTFADGMATGGTIDNQKRGWLQGGLATTRRRSIIRPTDKSKDSDEIEDNVRKFLPKEDLDQSYGSADAEIYERTGETGAARFVRAISAAEQNPHALAVSPKEQAQNISEASARESMVNLILALNAMVPNSGVNIDNQSQFVRRAQTYLHAITRQPLLVGYANGDKEFGWFLGPAFHVENGEASFQHRTIRHDVTAAIVAPAWWTRAKIKGHYAWIDLDGSGGAARDLWDNEEIEVGLRMPKNVNRSITAALINQSISAGDPFVFSARPSPVVTTPARKSAADHILQACSSNLSIKCAPQNLLVLGEELWRSPEVFVGSQKAEHVEVLSNMEGLLAVFTDLQFPGQLSGSDAEPYLDVDVTVLTSFGKATQVKAARLLRPVDAPLAKAADKADLVRPYTDDKAGFLVFNYPQPERYGGFFLFTRPAGQVVDFSDSRSTPRWEDGKRVAFPITAPTNPEILEIELRIQPRPDLMAGTVILTDKQLKVVKFVNEAQRSFKASHAAGLELTFDADGKLPDRITVSYPAMFDEQFKVAYPGFEQGVATKSLVLVFRIPGDSPVQASLSGPMLTADGRQEFVASAADLSRIRDSLTKQPGAEIGLQVGFNTAKGQLQVIPVVSSDSKTSTLKFKQASAPSLPDQVFKLASGTVKFTSPQSNDIDPKLSLVLDLQGQPAFKGRQELERAVADHLPIRVVFRSKSGAFNDVTVDALPTIILSHENKPLSVLLEISSASPRASLLAGSDWTVPEVVVYGSGRVKFSVKTATGNDPPVIKFTP